MVRLALVGCGGFGESHMKALAEAGDDVAIAACVDPNIDRARKAANYLECDRVATDCLDVLDHVDAAVVAVPHNFHHTVGIQLLNAGKHVLMEKPLALTEGQCLDLIRAEQTSGCTLMVAYVMRYHPLLVEMERLIKQRTFGDCFQLSIWTEQHTEHGPNHWTNHIDTLGGGQLFSHGCHYIDILLAWMGEPVEGTHIGSRLGTPWMEGEGTSNVTIRFANDALGYHFGTWGAQGTRLKYSFHAHCTKGMLEAQIRTGRLLLHRNAEEEVDGHEQILMEQTPGKKVPHELAHFLTCLRNGTRPLTSAIDSLHGLRVIWKLYEAERTGMIADLRNLQLDDTNLST